MITYVLALLVIFPGGNSGAMSNVVDFPTYEACKFAGEAFVAVAKKKEEKVRFYCFPAEGRGE